MPIRRLFFGQSAPRGAPHFHVRALVPILHSHAKDRSGKAVQVGSRVRLLSLSGNWFDELPPDEKQDVMSMIGEIFDVEEIDEYGHPWVRKSWPNEQEGKCHSHSIALEPHEMELIDEKAL